jgi:hypothetical protein
MSEIRIGDNGTVMQVTILDQDGVVDIRSATIQIVIKQRAKTITKTAQIVDGLKGICSFVLNEADITEEGTFSFQAEVRFLDGKVFNSDIGRFSVGKKL